MLGTEALVQFIPTIYITRNNLAPLTPAVSLHLSFFSLSLTSPFHWLAQPNSFLSSVPLKNNSVRYHLEAKQSPLKTGGTNDSSTTFSPSLTEAIFRVYSSIFPYGLNHLRTRQQRQLKTRNYLGQENGNKILWTATFFFSVKTNLSWANFSARLLSDILP